MSFPVPTRYNLTDDKNETVVVYNDGMEERLLPWSDGTSGGKNLVDWNGPQTFTSQTTIVRYLTSEQTEFVLSATAQINNDIKGLIIISAYNGSNSIAKNATAEVSSKAAERVSTTINMNGVTYTHMIITVGGASSGYSVTLSDLQFERRG